MKFDISDLEISDLYSVVVIKIDKSNTFFVPRITNLTKESMYYDGTEYSINNEETYQKLHNAIALYEMHKLAFNIDDASKTIDGLLNSKLEDKYNTKMEEIINSYSSRMDTVLEKLDSDASSITVFSDRLSIAFSRFEDTMVEVTEFLSNAIPSSTRTTITTLSTDLAAMIDKYDRLLSKSGYEFNAVTAKLKSLFDD